MKCELDYLGNLYKAGVSKDKMRDDLDFRFRLDFNFKLNSASNLFTCILDSLCDFHLEYIVFYL